jgi:hypothetical protein
LNIDSELSILYMWNISSCDPYSLMPVCVTPMCVTEHIDVSDFLLEIF